MRDGDSWKMGNKQGELDGHLMTPAFCLEVESESQSRDRDLGQRTVVSTSGRNRGQHSWRLRQLDVAG